MAGASHFSQSLAERVELLRQGLGHVRYSDRRFPRYGFLPGVDPHPRFHPEAHNPFPNEASADPLVVDQWRNNNHYLYGCDLFNHGYWWEAHEAWEAVWMGCRRDDTAARYLQALIQAANALLKARMGRPRALARLGGEVRRIFRVLGQGDYMGLSLARWPDAFDAFVTALLAPAQVLPVFPYLSLETIERRCAGTWPRTPDG